MRGVIASSTRFGSMLYVSGSMSTKTGLAPISDIGPAVAINVWAVVMTSSPGPTPTASSARCNAAVPEPTPTAPFAPTLAANACSKPATSLPRMKLVLSTTRCMAASISGLMAVYCALRSTKGISITQSPLLSSLESISGNASEYRSHAKQTSAQRAVRNCTQPELTDAIR